MKPVLLRRPVGHQAVAPRTGAWIETPRRREADAADAGSLPARERGLKLGGENALAYVPASLPARERGLKRPCAAATWRLATSLPARERGLKHHQVMELSAAYESLPARERGLKHEGVGIAGGERVSLPARERGLKRVPDGGRVAVPPVAPRTGAWIETTRRPRWPHRPPRRSPHGSVD